MYKIGETPHIKGFPEALSHLLPSSVTGWCRGCRCKTLTPGFCAVSCASRETLIPLWGELDAGWGVSEVYCLGNPSWDSFPREALPCPGYSQNPPALPEPCLSSAPAHLPQAPAPKNPCSPAGTWLCLPGHPSSSARGVQGMWPV